MRIFDLETNIGILSKFAKTAKWSNNKNHFKRVVKNAFNFTSLDELNKDKSHIIINIFPKPDSDSINTMNSRYFSEQAQKYDFSDFNQPSRKAYINKVDNLIASDMSNIKIFKHLDIAVGTGRRAIHIKELTGLRYDIVGVEISEEMCKIANSEV